MAIEYFSVDRRGFYKAGGTLDLFKDNPLGHTLLPVDDFISPEALRAHLKDLFPDGLSLHGWDYVTRHTDIVRSAGKHYVDYEVALELVLEYVRRSSFADSPSRWQCYFAFDSLGAAKAFRRDNRPIYRLEADKVLRRDQRWLRLGNQGVLGSYAAHRFWSGEATTTPDSEHMLVPPVTVVEQVA